MWEKKCFLEAANITLRVDNQLVFGNANWRFESGQHWAIIGGNGSGKTLLCRAIAGELPLAEGEIHYGFHTPSEKSPEQLIVLTSFEQQKAIVEDGPDSLRWFSLLQEAASTVKMLLSYNSVEEINPFEVRTHSRVDKAAYSALRRRIIQLLHIEELLNRPIPSLSNGEMRKTLLARALLKRPRLLILENVFTGLDAGYRLHLKQLLEGLLRHSSIRFLLTFSTMDELPDGITHVLCVDKCRIIAQGSLSEILKNDKARELLNAKRGEKTPRVVRFARGKASRHGKDEIIRMENVSVRYGRKRILSDINWSVRRGESWALVGPNGSGKSTLLSLISGDNPKAYNNGISIFGKRRGSGESIWDLKRRTGLVSSELHLHVPVYQTSYETVLSGFTDSFFSLRSARSHQRAAAKQILNKFGLLPFWREPFGSLSEGQQRMVLLARALVKSPELLLLDEPCQGLDAAHQRIFLRFIESVVRESEATIVYVTHVPNEIPRGITNALRLQDGRIASITAG